MTDQSAEITPPPPPEETSMEIHKPKPIHSWREFLKEYAIIVLGVATALAAEQGVEWLHWQGEVKTARQAIYAEIGNNNGLFAFRIASEACLQRQADEAGRMLDDLEAGRTPGHFTTFHTGLGGTLRDSDWQAERSAQALTHFPHDELARIGVYYSIFAKFDELESTERDAWRTLSVLRQPPKEVSAGDLLRLRAALMTARDVDRLYKLDATRQLNLSRQIGIAPVSGGRRVGEDRPHMFCTLDYEAYNQWAQDNP
jgi:hypothetical protein